MGKVKHKAADVIAAIEGSDGIKSVIARRLKVHRNTVNRYLDRYASAQEAYDEEVERIGDVAESVVIKSIKDGEVDTAKWYLRVKLKDRGYIGRQEVAGVPEAPLYVINWKEPDREDDNSA